MAYTVIDSIIFLLMVSICAVILSPVIFSNGMEKASSQSDLRQLASMSLLSMQTVKVDYFEYRILGDISDEIAGKAGINVHGKLYSDTSNALLGRGNRHKTVMEIASENIASQFKIHYEDGSIKLNPLTGDFDKKTIELINSSIRGRVDSRYSYHFSIIWSPFTGVPLEGSISTGKTPPESCVSAGAYTTMPYSTNINDDTIRALIKPELNDIEKCIEIQKNQCDKSEFKKDISKSLDASMEKCASVFVDDLWNKTAERIKVSDDTCDPFKTLDGFSGNITNRDYSSIAFEPKNTLKKLVAFYNAPLLEKLSDEIVEEVKAGRMEKDGASELIVKWMASRYMPSKGMAELKLWVDPYAV